MVVIVTSARSARESSTSSTRCVLRWPVAPSVRVASYTQRRPTSGVSAVVGISTAAGVSAGRATSGGASPIASAFVVDIGARGATTATSVVGRCVQPPRPMNIQATADLRAQSMAPGTARRRRSQRLQANRPAIVAAEATPTLPRSRTPSDRSRPPRARTPPTRSRRSSDAIAASWSWQMRGAIVDVAWPYASPASITDGLLPHGGGGRPVTHGRERGHRVALARRLRSIRPTQGRRLYRGRGHCWTAAGRRRCGALGAGTARNQQQDRKGWVGS